MGVGQRVLSATAVLAVVSILAVQFYSCGSKSTGTSTGAVTAYVTDDMSDYKQVTATIETISLLNSGSGARCEALTVPVTVNLANLADLMQLAAVSECPAGSYDRIHIEFDKSLELLVSSPTLTTRGCSFVSRKDEGNGVKELECAGPICTMDISGAVEVQPGQNSKFALDFVLKDFEAVNLDDPALCGVTLKVKALPAGEMAVLARPEAVTGLVSDVTVTDHRFTLVRGDSSFPIDYSGIPATRQPGLDSLLQTAEQGSLRVKVVGPDLAIPGGNVAASSIYARFEGAPPDPSGVSGIISIVSAATQTVSVDCTIAENQAVTPVAWLLVNLYGFDGTNYLVSKVETRADGAADG